MPGMIGAIVLAAGGSTRMGQAKQLMKFQGETLVHRAARAACEALCKPVIAVVGNQSAAVREALIDLPINFVENPNWQKGIGTSIRFGVDEVLRRSPDVDAIVILLCDQPMIDAKAIRRLIESRGDATVAVSRFGNAIGPPVIVGKKFFSELRLLRDDAGAKAIWKSHPDEVREVICESAAVDIDTPDDFALLNKFRAPTCDDESF